MLGLVISTLLVLNNFPFGHTTTTDPQNTCNDLSEKCNQAISALVDGKLKEMESIIEERIWSRIMGEREPPTTTEGVQETKDCEIEYDMKCFNLLLSNSNVMSLKEAQSRCSGAGAQMANIYSKAHDDLLVDRIKAIRTDPFFLFIGMTYNANMSKVNMNNGSTAEYVRWYPEGHFPKKEFHIMRFLVLPFASGMLNSVAADKATSHGVLCESKLEEPN